MKLNSINKEVTLKEYVTRQIDREYKKILLRHGQDVKGDDVIDAEDYLVREMSGLTQEEISMISADEFELLLKIIKNPFPSGEGTSN